MADNTKDNMISVGCPNCGEDLKIPTDSCPHCKNTLPDSIQKIVLEQSKVIKNKAADDAKLGAVFACFSAGATFAISIYAMYINAEGKLGIANDPLNLLDTFIMFIFAYGMYKNSRVSAVIVFIGFLFSKVFYIIETGSIYGIGIGLVFLYFFGKAIQGTFTYHKIEQANKRISQLNF